MALKFFFIVGFMIIIICLAALILFVLDNDKENFKDDEIWEDENKNKFE
jgi:hypothetical protein